MKLQNILIIALLVLPAAQLFGHGNGRLFDIQVVNNKIVAQGFNSGSPDGFGTIRPYVNSIHDHFNFIGTEQQPLGVTNYPSWDIGILPGAEISSLVGYELTIELVGSGKWVNVPPQDGTGLDQDFGIPELLNLSQQELQNNPVDIIRVRYSGQEIDTLNHGTFQLVESVSGVTADLDFEFFIENHNQSEIYFVEFVLKTNAPGIEDSDTIYVIQSPDGVGPIERLHFQSLYLENYLGTVIDTPFLFGDVNQDGQVNLLDVQPFVALINGGAFQIEGDINQDGNVDLLDVNPFVLLLSGG